MAGPPKPRRGEGGSPIDSSPPPALRALAGGVLLAFAAVFAVLGTGACIEGPLAVALGNLAICIPAVIFLTWGAVATWFDHPPTGEQPTTKNTEAAK